MTDDMTRRIKAEALKCARFFNRVNFDQCLSLLNADYSNIPKLPGLHALKTQRNNVLYVGMSANIWNRFDKGHPTLLRILLSGHQAEDLRLAVFTTTPMLNPYLKAIEDRVIFAFRPPYNKRIPSIGS